MDGGRCGTRPKMTRSDASVNRNVNRNSYVSRARRQTDQMEGGRCGTRPRMTSSGASVNRKVNRNSHASKAVLPTEQMEGGAVCCFC